MHAVLYYKRCGACSSTAERLTVAQEVVGSKPIRHPTFIYTLASLKRLFLFLRLHTRIPSSLTVRYSEGAVLMVSRAAEALWNTLSFPIIIRS